MESNIGNFEIKKLIQELNKIKEYFIVNSVCSEASLFNSFELLKSEEYSDIYRNVRYARSNFVYRLSEVLYNCNQNIGRDFLYHMIDFYFQCNDSKILDKDQDILDKGEFIYDFLYSCISCGINLIDVLDIVFYKNIECLKGEIKSDRVLIKFIEFFMCTDKLNPNGKIMLTSEAVYRCYVKFNHNNFDFDDLLEYSTNILCSLDLEYVNNNDYTKVDVTEAFMVDTMPYKVGSYLYKKYQDISYEKNLAYERCFTIECSKECYRDLIEFNVDGDVNYMPKNSYNVNSYFNILNKYPSRNNDVVENIPLKNKIQLYELANKEMIKRTTKKYKYGYSNTL